MYGPRLWVLFDEFNTSHEIQLLVDLIIYKRFADKAFGELVVFVGLCNPLKYVDLKEFRIGLQLKKKQLTTMHNVQLFPERVIQYIWDFGKISAENMNKYIEKKVELMGLEKTLSENLIFSIKNLYNYFEQECPYFNISLRDLERFYLLYKFFLIMIKNKDIPESEETPRYLLKRNLFKEELSGLKFEIKLEQKACILALAHCYLLRCFNHEQK